MRRALIDLCNSSRGGTSRCKEAVKADDHDMGHKDKLVPYGIFNMKTGFGTSRDWGILENQCNAFKHG
jgi:hypothetical protein